MLEDAARRGEVVVLAGAGLSAGNPSALPKWKALNAEIAEALRERLESGIGRPNWLREFMRKVDLARDEDRFPPAYQAQVIEEMAGERYFRALQALDIDLVNGGHEGLAALAAAGALRGIVTTNFDRLIELALARRGIDHVVAYDDPGFVQMSRRQRAGGRGALPIVKIHGCVSAPDSMVDTLKQRLRGRQRHLEECLRSFRPGHWLYLGFSASDLESSPDYLGLVAGAKGSAGATYVAYPGSPELGKGAQLLMAAHGDRGRIVVSEIGAELTALCQALGAAAPAGVPHDAAEGSAVVRTRLRSWAAGLSLSATGLCLAAMLESMGEAEAAVRILDRLIRKELDDERETADYRLLQLHHGRLGAAWGRFVAVPDLGGLPSNASVEATQSLHRILHTEVGFAASAWLTCLRLWLGQGREATSTALRLLAGMENGRWDGPGPRTEEEVVDAWLAAAQALVVEPYPELVNATVAGAIGRAKETGDVVRTARVVALWLLALAETPEDVPALARQYDEEFAEAQRVGDGVSSGMRSLALGRWHVGKGGLALAKTAGHETVARIALDHLQSAVAVLARQGMDPWVLYALVQLGKAHVDLRQIDQANALFQRVDAGLRRFPIWGFHLYEAAGLAKVLLGDDGAREDLRRSLERAEICGLPKRRALLSETMRENGLE
jgi:tetratricopeptide (TPR) repeat protein